MSSSMVVPAELQQQIDLLVSHYGRESCQEALEQSNAEDSPSASGSLSDALLNASFDACFVTNSKGNIERVNQATLDLFGYPDKRELCGKNISTVIGGSRASTHYKHFEQQQQNAHLERILNTMRDVLGKRKDGTEFPVQVGIRSLGEGEKCQYVAFCHDLSQHKGQLQQIQEEAKKIKEQLALLDGILDACFDSIILIDREGTISKANQAAVEEFGCHTVGDLVGKNVNTFVGGGHAQFHNQYLANFQLQGKTSSVFGKQRRVSARRLDGSEFPCQIGIRAITNAASEVGKIQYQDVMVGFIRNISKELQATKKMEHQLALLDGVLDACFDAIILIDKHGIISKVNQSALLEFGYSSADDLIGRNINILVGSGHAENHNAYIANFHRQGKTASNFGQQRRVSAHRKDGSEFPCHIGIRNVHHAHSGDDQDVTVGFVRNITKEVEANEKIEKQLALLDSVLNACFDAIVLIDHEGTITKVNKAALHEFGYGSESELLGQNIKILVGGGHADNHDAYLANFHQQGKTSSVFGKLRRVSARRKDGSEFPCQIGIQNVHLEDTKEHGGDVTVGFVRNITKELEAMELAIEKRAAEDLLMNMLPAPVAARLQANPGHIADHFATATVLFADIVGFTKMSSTLEPVAVVSLLNDLFSRFDDRLDRYGLNKVKTIGDCYMVTSIPSDRHPVQACAAVCHFALDLLEELEDYNRCQNATLEGELKSTLSVRVGINTGSVVAGVVGTKRFLYDIWGHAVNLASRMESTGLPGKIQISESVVERLSLEHFLVEKRGLVNVKGVGEVETHFLVGRAHTMSREEFHLNDEEVKERREEGAYQSMTDMLNVMQGGSFRQLPETST